MQVAASSTHNHGFATRIFPAFICIVVSCVAALPFFFIAEKPPGAGSLTVRMPVTHDFYLHYFQMQSFYQGLSSGDLYPRWEMDVNRGFGAPTFSFYPPGVYYITSVFFALGFGYQGVMIGAVLVMMIASALAFYLYAKRWLSIQAAIVATCLYVFSPYHLIDLYQRAAIAELLAFVWMPLILYFADSLIDFDSAHPRRRGQRAQLIAGFALSYGAFLWSHPASAYLFSIAFVFYLASRTWLRKNFKAVPPLIFALLLAFALSAAYLLPAATERELIHSDVIQSQYPYSTGYVFGDPARYGESAALFMKEIDQFWSFGAAILVISAVIILIGNRRKVTPIELSSAINSWIIAGAAVIFLMTPYSRWLAERIPNIEIGVFPWRLLAVSTLFCSLLIGQLLDSSPRTERRSSFTSNSLSVVSKITVLLALIVAVFMAKNLILGYLGSPAFSPSEEHFNYAMLPRSVNSELEKLPTVEPAILAEGNGDVIVQQWNPTHRSLRVSATAADKVVVRTFNFPGWSATVDDSPVEITKGTRVINSRRSLEVSSSEPEQPEATGDQDNLFLGDIGIRVPEGEHAVTLDYRPTKLRRAGTILSLTATAIALIFAAAPLIDLRRSK